jgi:hypothetical protein
MICEVKTELSRNEHIQGVNEQMAAVINKLKVVRSLTLEKGD